MASKRKGWDSLSPAYRQRLTRNGITEQGYRAGASIRNARGHSDAPERATYRRRLETARVDIRTSVPEFDELTKAEQERVARAWVVGITSKAEGRLDPKTGKRKPSTRQVIARMDALDLIADITGDALGSEFWKQFRAEYAQSFAAAA